jgi:hypothetical protein
MAKSMKTQILPNLINVFRFVICSSLLNLQDPGFMFETSWPWVSGP